MEKKSISWDKIALSQFVLAIKYVELNSPRNAEKVRKEIGEKIEVLLLNPEMFPRDKYKRNNNGLYRAFEVHHLRIAYYIGQNKIRILRVRHTSREPKKY